MVKAEVKTPNKRKSFANNNTPKIKQENDSPAKKIKLENGKTPTKGPFTPKVKQNQSPKNNVQISGGKPNKKNKNQTPKKPFAGTEQLNESPKVKKEKPAQTQKKQANESDEAKGKKKRRNVFYKLIVSVKEKQGTRDPEVLKAIDDKVKVITARGNDLTKTARKKLAILKRLRLICEEGSAVAAEKGRAAHLKQKEESKKLKAEKQQQKAVVQQAQPKKKQPAKPVQAKQEAKKVPVVKQEEESDDDDDEEDDDESGDEEEEEDSGDDQEDDEEENESDDDDNSDEDDDEEDSEEEQAPAPKGKPAASNKPKQQQDTKKKQQPTIEELKNTELVKKGQKRFVLFVGNIPYDTTKQDLTSHFAKVGNIVDVRVPTEKGSNKPRGFAYVEVDNETAYEKCLSMHHSQLKGRRINVMYTQGGKKKGDDKKKEIKAKNMKLHALRRQGKLAGSVRQNQKRSFRRNKSKTNPRGGEAS